MAGSTSWIGPALSVGGTLLSYSGQRSAGKAAAKQASVAAGNERAAAEFEAQQADYLAGQALASSQRAAVEERRLAALVKSRALAVAAASGAGVSDPTVVDILNRIQSEGAYRSAVALYEGEEKARSLRTAATARRLSGKSASDAALYEGASQQSAYNTRGISTLISGASSFMSDYGSYFNGA